MRGDGATENQGTLTPSCHPAQLSHAQANGATRPAEIWVTPREGHPSEVLLKDHRLQGRSEAGTEDCQGQALDFRMQRKPDSGLQPQRDGARVLIQIPAEVPLHPGVGTCCFLISPEGLPGFLTSSSPLFWFPVPTLPRTRQCLRFLCSLPAMSC